MNRIKIIKRVNQQLPLEGGETAAKKVSLASNKRQAVKAIGNWIDEWRAAKPEDARRAFAGLFGASPTAIG